jgi:hypothetical protein
MSDELIGVVVEERGFVGCGAVDGGVKCYLSRIRYETNFLIGECVLIR